MAQGRINFVVMADIAIIGGTGIGEKLMAMDGDPIRIETKFGPVEGKQVKHSGRTLLLMQRHSGGHKVPPHKVNYRAMAVALQTVGARACFASAAVGSLRPDWKPGTLAICTDMIDLTYRRLTLFDDEVQHTDMSEPFPASSVLKAACESLDQEIEEKATYVGLDGPRYESPAEVRYLGQIGGDVVGMTATSEAIVFREAGVPYACLAVVTNLGTGLSSSQLHHGEVTDIMKNVGPTVLEILMKAAQKYNQV